MLSGDDDHWWYRGRRRFLRAELDRLPIAPGARLLDAGCGSGRTLDELARYGRVSGADVSPEAVLAARRRGHDDVHRARVEELPFPDATFDVVTCLDVVEHTPDDRATLAELWRVTRPGGLLLVTVPAYQALWSWHDEVNLHFRRYDSPSLRAPRSGRLGRGAATRTSTACCSRPRPWCAWCSVAPAHPRPLGPRPHAARPQRPARAAARLEAWLVAAGSGCRRASRCSPCCAARPARRAGSAPRGCARGRPGRGGPPRRGGGMTLLAIERHALGPRVHVLGRRVHECHLGLALAAVALRASSRAWPSRCARRCRGPRGLAARQGLARPASRHPRHRRVVARAAPPPRRRARAAGPRPRAAAGGGIATAVVGAVNVASALTPDLPRRGRARCWPAPAGEVASRTRWRCPPGSRCSGSPGSSPGAAGARCSSRSCCSARSAWLDVAQGPRRRGGGAELGARRLLWRARGGVLGRARAPAARPRACRAARRCSAPRAGRVGAVAGRRLAR